MLIRRLLARYVDNILITLLALLIAGIGYLVGKSTNIRNNDFYFGLITFIIAFIIFYTIDYVILTKKSGKSVGKHLLKIKLVSDNNDLTYPKVFLRELLLQVITSVGPMGFILILFPYLTSDRKLLHDNVFKIDVVRNN